MPCASARPSLARSYAMTVTNSMGQLEPASPRPSSNFKSSAGRSCLNREASSIASCRREKWRTPPNDAADPNPGLPTKLGGARSTVAVPMLKDDELVGAVVIYRQEVRPFTDKQIELVQ